jgi:putative membrane protein
MQRLFSKENAERIANAIRDAESRTSGEIIAVVAPESSSYLYVPFMWAALAALLVPWPLIFFTWMPVLKIYLIQLIVFLALLLMFWSRRMRMKLTPKRIRDSRAHRRAVEQFLAQNLHTTKSRTGVLIFVSVAERYAEILADTGIDAKVPKGTWQQIVDEMTRLIGDGRATDGFVHAVQEVGKHLAKHVPPGSEDPNELPDHLIILTD